MLKTATTTTTAVPCNKIKKVIVPKKVNMAAATKSGLASDIDPKHDQNIPPTGNLSVDSLVESSLVKSSLVESSLVEGQVGENIQNNNEDDDDATTLNDNENEALWKRELDQGSDSDSEMEMEMEMDTEEEEPWIDVVKGRGQIVEPTDRDNEVAGENRRKLADLMAAESNRSFVDLNLLFHQNLSEHSLRIKSMKKDDPETYANYQSFMKSKNRFKAMSDPVKIASRRRQRSLKTTLKKKSLKLPPTNTNNNTNENENHNHNAATATATATATAIIERLEKLQNTLNLLLQQQH
jgi:hypothetical protein